METSRTALEIDANEKVIIAASWKSKEEQPEFGDSAYAYFVQVMTYRREIAKQLLIETHIENRSYLKENLEHCNDKLRNILGL